MNEISTCSTCGLIGKEIYESSLEPCQECGALHIPGTLDKLDRLNSELAQAKAVAVQWVTTEDSPCYSCDKINEACLKDFCPRRQNWHPRPSLAEMVQMAADRAKAKHPHFADTLGDAVHKVTEECLELVTAYNDHRDGTQNLPRIADEALDILGVTRRLMEMLLETLTDDEWRLVENNLRGTGQDDRVKV